jgi:thermostable 8-oxoguanine DNA glycosylase
MEEDFGRALAEGAEQALSESTMTEAKKSLVAAVESVQRNEDVETKLFNLKQQGQERWERDDVIWFEIVLSLATLGKSEGSQLIFDEQDNLVNERYERVSFESIAQMDQETRASELREILLSADVRFHNKKSEALVKNFEFIKQEYGDPKGAKSAFEDQEGVDEKIAFLKQFSQIGPKYARNIGMDLYLPDFRYFIAVDSRIENIMGDAGFPYEDKSYEEQEAFLRSVAEELGCEPWELDRILYHFETEVRAQL